MWLITAGRTSRIQALSRRRMAARPLIYSAPTPQPIQRPASAWRLASYDARR